MVPCSGVNTEHVPIYIFVLFRGLIDKEVEDISCIRKHKQKCGNLLQVGLQILAFQEE